jgi:membrane fusion protein (multidrug efflux system)
MSDQTALSEDDFDVSLDEAPKAAPVVATPRRSPLRIVLLASLGLAAVAWTAHFIYHAWTHEVTEDAYVTGSIHTVSPRLAGVVQEILVKENSTVTAGQPLVKLDSRDLEIRHDQARNALEQATAQLGQTAAQLSDAQAQERMATAQATAASAQIARDEANATKARTDLDRANQLFSQPSSGAISRSDLDSAKAGSQTTSASVDAARASFAAAQAAGESAKAKVQAAQAAHDAAAAAQHMAETSLKDSELQLSYTTIAAPTAGRISRKFVEVGDHLQPGQALFSLVEPEVWVEANFKETQLARMHPGQEVEMTVDAIPGHQFRGVIDSFSPATGSQFALLPPDNATGNFTKVVQRVPVKILFAPESLGSLREQIRPGLSTVVSVRSR